MTDCFFHDLLYTSRHTNKTESTEHIVLDDLDSNTWKELLWKAGKPNCIAEETITICRSHKTQIDGMFRGRLCNNPLDLPSHSAKSKYAIS